MVNPLERSWEPGQVAVMEALRDWSVTFTELNLHMSHFMGLPTSDANALGQVVWAAEADEPLSPAQLAARIGMTTGAVTVLLHRLERAGLVERSREQTDRRRVTLRPTPLARQQAHAFMEVASEEISSTLLDLDPAALAAATEVLARMTRAAGEANRRLAEEGRVPRAGAEGSRTTDSP